MDSGVYLTGMSDDKLNIVIADSQLLIVEALKSVLGLFFIIRNTVSNKKDLITELESGIPGLLIVDPVLIDFESIRELKEIIGKYPGMKVVILTNNVTLNEFKGMTGIGIKNILHKNTDLDDLYECIVAASTGKRYFSEIFMDMLLENDDKKVYPAEIAQLTVTETEIVRLIAQGFTTKQIASQKFISFHTVMTHRKNILRKLGVSNASELIMYAAKAGIIDTIEYHI